MIKSITIQDIATEAGVGKATVSRVINGSGYVSPETERRVRHAMEKYRFQPNAAAQALSRQESDMVGLVLPEINNPFFSEMIQGITSTLENAGFTVVLSGSGNDPERDIRILESMHRLRIRGLIYVPACDYNDESQLTKITSTLEQIGCRIVILDRPIANLQYDCVTTNNFQGALACTQSLIDAGHSRIGIVVGKWDQSIARERMRGFRAALDRAKLTLNEQDIVYGEFEEKATYDLVSRMIDSGDYPHAFFISNNLSELGFLKAVFERGLKIPEDIAFVCFDKLLSQDIFKLPYTYLERNVRDLGEQAAQLLLSRFVDPDGPIQRVVVMSKVVLCGSERKM